MSGELEAAAAESLLSIVRPKPRHPPEPGATCANCGAPLQGPYCHACGQGADMHKRSLGHLVLEALEAMFELDGRFWRTLPALFFRPGRLARDYIEGRLARHVPPFRTFLVALVLFIFAAEHATHEQTLADQRRKVAAARALATPQGRAAEVVRMRGDAGKDYGEEMADAAHERVQALKDPDEKPAQVQATYDKATARAKVHYDKALQRADRVAQGLPARLPEDDAAKAARDAKGWFRPGLRKAVANPDYYWTVVFTWAHRLAVLLLPIVGVSLALVYRRRKDIFIYDHLLVAMNLLSFSFLTNALGLILPPVAMPYWFGFVALWTPVNLFQTLRGAYGSSVLGAALKTLVVWSITLFSSLMLLAGLLVLAIAVL